MLTIDQIKSATALINSQAAQIKDLSSPKPEDPALVQAENDLNAAVTANTPPAPAPAEPTPTPAP